MQSDISVARPFAVYRMAQEGERFHLVDVRTPAEYSDGHALGAVSEPLDGFDAHRITTRLGEGAGTTSPVYLLCASGNRARQAAVKLREQGLDKLMVVEGGTQVWDERNLPMRRQSKRLSLERQTQISVGVLLLLTLAKGTLLHPLFLALIGLLGVGLVFAGVTARCGLTALLARMPWNRLQSDHQVSA